MKRIFINNRAKILAILVSLVMLVAIGITANANLLNARAADFSTNLSKEESLAAAKEMITEVCEEGFTLLKNETVSAASLAYNWYSQPMGFARGNPRNVSALPIAPGAAGVYAPFTATLAGVSVFGKNSAKSKFIYNGQGSSSGGAHSNPVDICESLENVGFDVNPTLKAFYENDALSGNASGQAETPIGSYANANPAISYDGVAYGENITGLYTDAALVVISRTGSEGSDVSSGTATDDTHYLELTQAEKDLFAMVKSLNFQRVIAVLNIGQQMELDFLNDDAYGIDAAIWVGGGPGAVGMTAFGKVIAGTANPSGRTVDTYYKDFTKDPTYFNFGSNTPGGANGDKYYIEGVATAQSKGFNNYQEGIYVGYRYYETRGYLEYLEDDNYDWYDDNVVYPFGYGLSYTSFEWEIVDSAPANDGVLTKDGEISVSVKVKNTGRTAGKDVVQLYYTTPYTDEIEKAHVVLGGFAKTRVLDAGAEQILKITMKVRDMASYDYNDANDNGFEGYELDAGEYTISVAKNANDAWRDSELKLDYEISGNGFQYRENHDGTYDVVNQFDHASNGMVGDPMSRKDFEGTFPHFLTKEERTVSADYLANLGLPLQGETNRFTVNEDYDEGQPWYSATAPTQRETALLGDEEGIIIFSDLVGLDKNDSLWEDFMDQLTVTQLQSVVSTGSFVTASLPALGVPALLTLDGPMGFVGNASNGPTQLETQANNGNYPSTCIVASTWNEPLIEKMGETKGNEGLTNGYNGIYAPGVNIHRSPFCGRNFEYYSEDGFLSGKIAAAEVKGIQSKGVIAFVKHYAFRETEVEGGKVALWATEQSLREIYLRAFEIPVVEADAWGMMVSNNTIGESWWTGMDYGLVTEVLKNEWGFRGAVITDWPSNFQNVNGMSAMVRAGTDYILANVDIDLITSATATQLTALRNAAKNVLYTVTLTNAMPRYNAEREVITTSNKFAIDVSTSFTRFQNKTAKFPEAVKSYTVDGELPAGFSINATSGIISGDAKAAATGKYTITINAYVNGFVFDRNELTIIIPGLSYSSSTLASGNVGTQYVGTVASAQSSYAGGINYSLKSGTLPAGVTLDSSGNLIGTPTASGTFTFTVIASAANVADVESTFTLTIGDKDATITDLENAIKDLQDKVAALEDTSGGCNSSIAIGSGVIVATIIIAGAIALVMFRKKEQK